MHLHDLFNADIVYLCVPYLCRKCGLDALAGKVIAVDISIWIVQFIKAMRDKDGNVIEDAHLTGTLRRVLKLLYHGVLPVFVFDGKTPELKYRTVRLRNSIKTRGEASAT